MRCAVVNTVVARAAKKKLAAKELAKERAARVKRDEEDADFGKLTLKERKKKEKEKAKRVANKGARNRARTLAWPCWRGTWTWRRAG